MSPTTQLSFSIWIRSLLINGVLMSVFFADLEIGYVNIFIATVIFLVGLFITLPLLIIIKPIVRMSLNAPYPCRISHIWLAFLLAGVAFAFLYITIQLLDLNAEPSKYKSLTICPMVSVVLATFTISHSFKKLKMERYEQDLV